MICSIFIAGIDEISHGASISSGATELSVQYKTTDIRFTYSYVIMQSSKMSRNSQKLI